MNDITTKDNIKSKIYTIRNLKVMLDSDLAKLYEVETRNLNKAVKRNIGRFPKDFMFQLTNKEFSDLLFQNGTANWNKKRFEPYAFTEQGVSMLSAILKSDIAIKVSVKIIRAFVSMRKIINNNNEILINQEYVRTKLYQHEEKINKLFDAIEDKTLTRKQGIFYDGEIFDAQ